MNPLKISVIIPVYNTANYLQDCLESCINQTFVDYEVIIIDDGSTDDSHSVISRFLHLSNFQYHYKKNGGASSARNLGLSLAKGDYIFFLDSDDYLTQDALSTLASKANETKMDFVLSNSFLTLTKSNQIKRTKLFINSNFNNSPSSFIERVIISEARAWRVTGCLYKASIIYEHNLTFPEGIVTEDVFFNLEFLRKATRMFVISEPVLVVRKRNDSVTATYNENMLHIILKLDKELRSYFDSKELTLNDYKIIDELLIRNTIITIFQESVHLRSFNSIYDRMNLILSQSSIKSAINSGRKLTQYHRSFLARLYVKITFVLIKTNQIRIYAALNFAMVSIKKWFKHN